VINSWTAIDVSSKPFTLVSTCRAVELNRLESRSPAKKHVHHDGEQQQHVADVRLAWKSLISATLAVGKRQINRQITDRICDGEYTNGGMKKRQRCTDGCF
jgi:hypothetical protein